jgi:transcriptional regulator with GAF, ATPase, and Fis domain
MDDVFFFGIADSLIPLWRLTSIPPCFMMKTWNLFSYDKKGHDMLSIEVICESQPARTVRLGQGKLSIGRSNHHDIIIQSAGVSANHGIIFSSQHDYIYDDLQSRNGTVLLRAGQRIQLGKQTPTQIVLSDGDEIYPGGVVAGNLSLKIRLPPKEIAAPQHDEEVGAEEATILFESSIHASREIVSQLAGAQDHLFLLSEFSQKAVQAQTKEAIMQVLTDTVFRALPVATHLIVFTKSTDGFKPVFAKAAKAGNDTGMGKIAISRTILQKAHQKGVAILFQNARQELNKAQSLEISGIQACICAPLWTQGISQGIIQVDNRESNAAFSRADLALLSLLALYLAPVLDNLKLTARIKAERDFLREELGKQKQPEILGESAAMKKVVEIAAKGARDASVTILIGGETGTGKEVLARSIHHWSRRNKQPFIPINCTTLPKDLAESELFGHAKGAYTGAAADRQGKFELADHGTIFLDEVGDMPLDLQVKLLRVLQEREFQRVGDNTTIKVDVRVIAATNKDLKDAVKKGTFREDLYYRLNVFPLHLPALRQRPGDTLILAQSFLRKYCQEKGKEEMHLSKNAEELLAQYDWPGNVRELQNVMERAVILGEGQVIDSYDLNLEFQPEICSAGSQDYRQQVFQAKRQIVLNALAQCDQNQSLTAQMLGMKQGNFSRLLKDLKIR